MWRDGGWEVEGTDRIKEHHLSTESLQPEQKKKTNKYCINSFTTFTTN